MVEDRLNSLLMAWQEQLRQGRDVSAVELCCDCPELAAELSQRIGILRQMKELMQLEDTLRTPDAPTFPQLGTSALPAAVARYEILLPNRPTRLPILPVNAH